MPGKLTNQFRTPERQQKALSRPRTFYVQNTHTVSIINKRTRKAGATGGRGFWTTRPGR